ncbi:MAG: hemerythrin family protein [Spirochaetales bacterium]|nr:hemerythrin family protein [Spirochaetales bacterium]
MAGLVVWTPELSVKVDLFDVQHKKLIELLNTLFVAMREGHGREAVGPVINELLEYTKYHFSSEEKAFRQFHYPDAENHIRQHKLFVEKVTDFQTRFQHNEIMVTVEVLSFLVDWIASHIKGSDKQYSDFFMGKTISE